MRPLSSSTAGTAARVNGTMSGAARFARDLDAVAGAEIMDGAHAAQHGAVLEFGGEAQKIGVVEFLVARSRGSAARGR